MIIDRLFEDVKKKGPVCVGLDTDFSYLPEGYLGKRTKSEAILSFNKEIIDATKDVSGCYKVQIAYYESLGLDGLIAYKETLEYLRKQNLIAIADVKRGDIAATAEKYAKAHFSGDFEADFITLSPYMGMDSVTPYLDYIKSGEKGVFILVRTSNPGSKDFQYQKIGKETLYDIVGKNVSELGKEYIGKCGYSAIGAVIGGTSALEASEIRECLSDTFFLIPGYGAQGAKASDIALYLKDGNGGVVNSSRAVLLAYKKDAGVSFEKAARNEVLRMRGEILDACGV